jgi:hypothetical protein
VRHILHIACCCGPLLAQGVTVQSVQAPLSPPARYLHGMQHEPLLQSFVLFGGRNDTAELSDTWRYNPTTGWQQQQPLVRPIASTVLTTFRRQNSNHVDFYLDRDRGAIWRWNGSDWQRRLTNGQPPPAGQFHVATCFDESRGVLVHIEANAAAGGWTHVVHELDPGDNWSAPSFPTQPNILAAAAAAWMPLNGVVLHGGIDSTLPTGPTWSTETWRWDGVDFSRMAQTGPVGQHRHALEWHHARARLSMYASQGDLLEWQPSSQSPGWQLVATGLPVHTASPLAYDPGSEALYTFGAGFTTAASNAFHLVESASPGRAREYGLGCLGSRGLLTLEVGTGQRPWLGDFWNPLLNNALPFAGVFWIYGLDTVSWSGMPVPVDLSIFGLNGCFALHSANDLVFRTADSAGRDRPQISVPTDLVLLGFRFYLQGGAIDPAANPGGGVLSNGVEATIGLR